MISAVYLIVCTANGKKYVGASKNVRKRCIQHRSALRRGTHGNPGLKADASTFGPGAFEFHILEEVSREQLEQSEREWMKKLAPEYNEMIPAATANGWKASESARAKRSAAMKAAWGRPEVRAKMSAAVKAACARPEVRAKWSAAMKAAGARPEARAKRSAALQAALARPEVRAKISATSKATWARPEVRAKTLAARKKRMANEP